MGMIAAITPRKKVQIPRYSISDTDTKYVKSEDL